MAISRVASSVAKNASNSTTGLVVTFGVTATPGNLAVLAIANTSMVYITPTGNIEWVYFAFGAAGVLALGNIKAAQSSVTINQGVTGAMSAVYAEYSGVGLISFDRSQGGTGTGTALASGNAGTTSQANQLWLGVMLSAAARPATNSLFSAPTNSFAIVDQAQTTLNTTNDRTSALLERIVSATGTPNAGATAAISGVWIALVAALSQAASPGGGLIVAPGFNGNLNG